MKKSAPKNPPRAHMRDVKDWLISKGPVTAAMFPQVKSMKDVILRLRMAGWPIVTTLHQYFDRFGVEHTRAEYRLQGNWTNRPLPFGDNRGTRSKRKNFYPPEKTPSRTGDGIPEPGRPESGDLQIGEEARQAGNPDASARVPVDGVRQELEGDARLIGGLPEPETRTDQCVDTDRYPASPGAG